MIFQKSLIALLISFGMTTSINCMGQEPRTNSCFDFTVTLIKFLSKIYFEPYISKLHHHKDLKVFTEKEKTLFEKVPSDNKVDIVSYLQPKDRKKFRGLSKDYRKIYFAYKQRKFTKTTQKCNFGYLILNRKAFNNAIKLTIGDERKKPLNESYLSPSEKFYNLDAFTKSDFYKNKLNLNIKMNLNKDPEKINKNFVVFIDVLKKIIENPNHKFIVDLSGLRKISPSLFATTKGINYIILRNNIGDDGAKELLKTIKGHEKNIIHMDLSENNITDKVQKMFNDLPVTFDWEKDNK